MEFTCYYLKTSTYRPDNLHRSASKSPRNSRYGARSSGRLSYFATFATKLREGNVFSMGVCLFIHRGSLVVIRHIVQVVYLTFATIARQLSCEKVIFSVVCVSVCSQGSLVVIRHIAQVVYLTLLPLPIKEVREGNFSDVCVSVRLSVCRVGVPM